eukprot:2820388-Pyramimonas_sp.AAC.1
MDPGGDPGTDFADLVRPPFDIYSGAHPTQTPSVASKAARKQVPKPSGARRCPGWPAHHHGAAPMPRPGPATNFEDSPSSGAHPP